LEGVTLAGIDQVLRDIANSVEVSPETLAGAVQNKVREKWDPLLPEGMLEASFASSYIDVPGVSRVLAERLAIGA